MHVSDVMLSGLGAQRTIPLLMLNTQGPNRENNAKSLKRTCRNA
jgi:hypothetical protein